MRYREFIQDLPSALLETAYIRQQDRQVIDQLGEMFSIGIEYEFFVDDDRILDFIDQHKINYDPGPTTFARHDLPHIVFDLIKKSRSAWGIDPADIGDVELDTSVDHGVEVITRPLSFQRSIEVYKKMCRVIGEIGSTSENTGMHVNISIKNQDMTKINHTKLLMLLDPDLQKDIFPIRSYVEDVFSELLLNSSKIIDKMASGRDYIKTFENYIDTDKKYQQINFNHLHEQNDLARLELRYFGGEGYETRTNTVINGLYAAARAVGAAYDPDYLENKYRSRLTKFIDIIFQQQRDQIIRDSIVKLSGHITLSSAQQKKLESARSFVEYKNAMESVINLIYKKANTPEELLYAANKIRRRLPAYLETRIAQDADLALEYARYVLKPAGLPRDQPGRFELAEPAIARSPRLAIHYAHDVLKPAEVPHDQPGRFELAEPAIARSARLAYDYAQDILRGPFEAGEPAIARDAWLAYRYSLDVLKPARVPHDQPGRFELGEPAIAQNAQLALEYAFYILRGPFVAGEPAIAQDHQYAYVYARDVLKDPDPDTWGERYLAQQGKNQ